MKEFLKKFPGVITEDNKKLEARVNSDLKPLASCPVFTGGFMVVVLVVAACPI